MADPFEPTSPPPAPEPIPPNPNPPPEPSPRGETTQSTGLPSNIAAALACIPLVGGLIFWFLEKHDNFVRFYAMQSIIFGGVWVVFNIISRIVFEIFGSIPALGSLLVFLWAIIQALKYTEASISGLLGLLEIVFSITLGILIFHQALTVQVIVGALLIMVAAALPHISDLFARSSRSTLL